MIMKHVVRFTLGLALAAALAGYAFADGGKDGGKGGGGSSGSGSGKDGGSGSGKTEGATKPPDNQAPERQAESGKKPENEKEDVDRPENEPAESHNGLRDDRGPGGGSSNSGPGNNTIRTRVPLTPTAAGTVIGAEGHADLRTIGDQRRLTVEVEADVADNTAFDVFACSGVSAATCTKIGSVTILLGEGELEIENGGSLPPIIARIEVRRPTTGVVVATAAF